MSAQVFEFGSFRLDMRERQLFCQGRPVPLRGKVLDTLWVLVQQAGSLVRKDELMKTIWADRIVEENNLEHNLCVLRKIFAQGEGRHGFIETVPRHGYRFVADVRAIGEDSVTLPSLETREDEFIAERDSELEQVRLAMKKAQNGARRMVFLSGEAGIGKSALVRRFLTGLKDADSVSIALGECVEQCSPGEAYMPVLEAFTQLCRQPDGQYFVDNLRQRAPSWLFQIASAVAPNERLALQQSTLGLTQERMLREGVDALRGMATGKLLILVLEDLHWSDDSTLDFLSRISQDQAPAHLLVIGTYRLSEANEKSRSVVSLVQQLRLRGACTELPLNLLSERGIEAYMHKRLGGPLAPRLAQLFHQRTEGNALFVTALMNFWLENGSLLKSKNHWTLSSLAQGVDLPEPDTLRRVIEEQVERLPLSEREVVEAASAVGVEFCAASVASALNCSPAVVETLCSSMARRGRLFSICGQIDWPDGTVCQRYRFTHSLYREITYKRLPAGLRVRWHRRIGERLEQAFAGEKDQITAELGEHFQQGRDARRAIHYLKKTARQCLERGAAPEAVFNLTNALSMLRRIPEQRERVRLQLSIDAMLAPVLGASKGFGDAETETAFRRAYELARQLGEEERQFPIIFGFAVMLELRGQYRKAQELMEKYLPNEERRGRYMVEGLDLLACSRFHQGAFADALRHAERGTTLYCAGTHSPLSGSLGEHPGIDCFTWMALTLWFLGRPNRALAKAEHAVSLADNPAYAYSRATAWAQRAVLHQLRREVKATRLWAQRTMNLAAEQGFPYREAVGKVLNGWALAQSGQPDLGVAELKAGIAGCRAAGAELDRPYHMALLAEVHIRARKYREATATLREALEQVGNAGCFYYEAELWRLHGHLNWLSATDRVAASEGFYRSLDIAQRQHAKSLELRAATSLARMLRDAGECRRGVEVVLPVYRSFAGVRETPDLRDARLEIEALEEDAARKIAV